MKAWLVSCGLVLVLCAPIRAQERADKVFVNARVWTGDRANPSAEALAIRGDRILTVGSKADVLKAAGPATSIVDLHGFPVVPGFNDAHWHFAALRDADLVDSGSVEELQRRLAEQAKAHPGAIWITGRGWGYTDFPGRVPDRKYVDQVIQDKPVFLWERDGHMGVANTKALELAGLTDATPDPPHGRIEHDSTGRLTGELKEAAMALVAGKIPPPSPEELYQALDATMKKAASYGLTSLQEASAGLQPDEMSAFERLLAEGNFTVRFYVSIPLLKHATPDDLARFDSLRKTFRGPLLKFGSAKGMLDGTVDAKTALLTAPYVGGGNGIPMWTQEELDHAVALYDRNGFQIWLHAIGDKAIHMALDAYESAAAGNHSSGRRHRVEHAEVPDPRDFARFKQLGVIASTQALFANPDSTTLENYAVLLGPERASHANAFRLFDEAGAMQAFGSDYPVFSMEVLRGIYCAATRTTPAGKPAGGWYPQNRIPVEAALRHFTADAAYASFDEQEKGTLSAGKLADFVVLSRDILSEPPAAILDAKVLLTVMGGRVTYRQGKTDQPPTVSF
jgi:predicted amidohydrolase YtcJ